MNRILLFCALGALWGCRTVTEPTAEAITLSCSTSESSKVASLTAGDEVAVFARIDGTETYFLEAEKFITGSDSKTLSKTPAMYYPETKQAVNFYAYFPYHTGTFSVPSDQSTATALKKADLCWANASSTPVATPVSLQFSHLFARLIISTNQPTTKIACQVVPNGVLNAATAQFTLTGGKSEMFTTGNELILPPQTINRLVLAVSGVEYIYDGSINLQPGQTTTVNLTLHPSTKTATLNGSSTSNWTTSSQQGTPEQDVSNTLTIHWPKCHPKSTAVDKIILNIKDPTHGTTSNYTVSNGISYANQTFTVPFASATLHYPYVIEDIALYQSNTWIHESTTILGAAVVKSGDCVVGVKQPLNPPAPGDCVKIGAIYWAKGNLVAVSKSNNYECKVGAPTDGGLYFQFGSLIGYKGGNQVNGGTGVGLPQAPLTTNGAYWNGAGYSWASDAMVWPSETTSTPSAWPSNNGSAAGDRNTVVDQWFFNYNTAPYSNTGQNIRGFSGSFTGDKGSGTLGAGRYAKWGIGDPCTYYLGDPWRLPTPTELASITGKTGPTWVSWTTAGVTGRWATASQTFGGVSGPGAWFGTGLSTGSGTPNPSTNLFFPAAGYRGTSNGSFLFVAVYGYYRNSSVYSAKYGYDLRVHELYGLAPQILDDRSAGLPVRCVSEAP